MIVVDQIGVAKLFRGPRPSQEDLTNVKFDINLEVGWFEFFHGHERQEQDWCMALNVTYFHKPLSDFTVPSRLAVLSVIDQARYWLFKGQNVLIHCLHGEDRTGICIAAYRIKYQGWTVDRAREEMFSLGFHKFPYEPWADILPTFVI